MKSQIITRVETRPGITRRGWPQWLKASIALWFSVINLQHLAVPNSSGQVTPIFTNNHTQPALIGSYFSGTSLDAGGAQPVMVRADSTISFDWGLGSPHPALEPD